MKYNELSMKRAVPRKRVGRGIAAGQGKTAGRGTKGQNSRTGSKKKPGFEGGQNPLAQRLPKLRGFNSHIRQNAVIYTGQLDSLPTVVDNQTLADAGLVNSAFDMVKLIFKGDIEKKHSVKLQFASAGAIKAVQKAGGLFIVSAQVARPAKSKDENQNPAETTKK